MRVDEYSIESSKSRAAAAVALAGLPHAGSHVL